MSAVHLSAHASGDPQDFQTRRVLFVCLVAALILGTIGYERYDPAMNFLDALYYAVQLFVLHGHHLEHTTPWELHVGRGLAAATTVVAAWRLFRRMWVEEGAARGLRRISDHTIVCGLGEKGLAVVRRLRERGIPVVAIEATPKPAIAAACRELGVHLIAGDAASPEVLQSARIDRASQVIALCPDDSTNCDIAAHVCRLSARAQRAYPVKCRIQVGDAEARQTLQNLLAGRDDARGTLVRFFDCFDPEAFQLLVHELPIDHDGVRAGDPRQVHLVVLGLGRMGRALMLRAAQLGVFANDRRLKISVVDRQAHKHRDEVLFRCPKIQEVCDLEFHNAEAASPETRALLAQWCSEDDKITSVAICFDDEQRALEIALQLPHLAASRTIPVAVRMSGQSGVARLLKEARARNLAEVPLHPFGMEERAAEMGAVGDDSGELFARKIHAAYLKMRRKDAGQLEKLATDPAMRDWDELNEDFRESNRQQHGHLYVKMRAIDCEIAHEDDPRAAITAFQSEELQLLAEMEHRRWIAEKLVAGWIFAPGRKDERRRTNSSIVPWSELTEATKEYDRVAVRLIPRLLSGAGRKICRRTPSQPPAPR